MNPTATSAPPEVKKDWDEVISLVLMTVKDDHPDSLPEVVHVRLSNKCEEMENTELRAAHYQGPESGEQFLMPLEESRRLRLQTLILKAKGGSAYSFVTLSKSGKEKLIWSVSRVK